MTLDWDAHSRLSGNLSKTRLLQRRRVKFEVVFDEARDEVIAVIVTRLGANPNPLAGRITYRLEVVR